MAKIESPVPPLSAIPTLSLFFKLDAPSGASFQGPAIFSLSCFSTGFSDDMEPSELVGDKRKTDKVMLRKLR